MMFVVVDVLYSHIINNEGCNVGGYNFVRTKHKYTGLDMFRKTSHVSHQLEIVIDFINYNQRRVQPDQCYFTVQITGSTFECSL